MVSHPETGSDSPIGSDRDRGRDKLHHEPYEQMLSMIQHYLLLHDG